MATHRLRILHLSDLHERVALPWMDEERKTRIRLGEAGRARVLEENFFDVLGAMRCSRPIDIVCFTGDVADWGLAEEYAEAEKLLRRILDAVQVPIERLFVVPGNHDVRRETNKDAWKEMRSLAQKWPDEVSLWMGGLNPPRSAASEWREAILERTNAFWDWVANSLGRPCLRPSNNCHGRLGYRQDVQALKYSFPVHVIGLDSAWLSGDKHDCQNLCLTQHQVDLLTRNGRQRLPGFRLGLVHHPLSDLADHRPCQRFLADTVDLLLHGHQHAPVVQQVVDPDRNILVIAAGSLYEGDREDKWTNAFHVIDVHLDSDGRPLRYDVEFWGWSRHGHWHRDGALYKAASDGQLSWSTALGKRESDTNQRVTSSTGFDLAPAQPLAQQGSEGPLAGQAEMKIAGSSEFQDLAALIERVRNLYTEFRVSEIEPYAAALERKLRATALTGELIRQGWITLAQIEDQKLWLAKQARQPVDVSRLRALRQEADNVID